MFLAVQRQGEGTPSQTPNPSRVRKYTIMLRQMLIFSIEPILLVKSD